MDLRPTPRLGAVPGSHLALTGPFFQQQPLEYLLGASVQSAVTSQLPTLLPPFVQPAVDASVAALAVQRAGDTMAGPLYSATLVPTANAEYATRYYVDLMVSAATGIAEPTTAGNWLRTGAATWVQGLPLSGGSVTGQTTFYGLLDVGVGPAGKLRFNAGTGTPFEISGSGGDLAIGGPGTIAVSAPLAMQAPATLALAQNAATALQAVPLQQLNSAIAGVTQTSLGGPFLPLAGGTLAAMNAGGVGLTLDVNANAARGITLTTSLSNSVGLLVTAGSSGGAARGIQVETTVGTGLGVFNRGVTTTGVAVRNEAGTGLNTVALSVINAAGTGIALLVDNPSADGGSAIEVRRSNAGASSPSIRMRMSTALLPPIGQEFGALAFAGSIAPGGFANGAVIAASAASAWAANTPGGTRLDFRITPPGSTVPADALTIDQDRRTSLWDGTQMVAVTFGAPDSGGTGFRQLVVPN